MNWRSQLTLLGIPTAIALFSIALSQRYEIAVTQPGIAYVLNRWTGTTKVCAFQYSDTTCYEVKTK